VLDVTDQFAVKQLTGAQITGESTFSVALLDTTTKGDFRRYAVVSPQAMRKPLGLSRAEIANIRNQSGKGYLVITHKDLATGAQTLADFHNGQVVTTDQIYDEFGWGLPDATAIRDFLRWRLTHGTPVARVLLFGDATWDIKGYLGYGTKNYVPTYERRFLPPTSNPYSTDDWLGYLEPAPNDSLGNCFWPTIPMARIPAGSVEEGEAIVARLLDYTTNPELGAWQNRIMLVADDDRIGTSCPPYWDRTNDLHTIYAEELSRRAYPRVFDRTKVYLTEYPIESTGLKPLARKAFVKALNDGVLVTNFVGHGDELRLAQEEVFNPASVNLVSTGRRLTFFIAASCNVSRFDTPAGSSMAEELFRREEGGTVGSLASTHLCFPQQNQVLNVNFVFGMFDSSRVTHPTRYTADALQVAKVRTVAFGLRGNSWWTNDEMYALFGDPAQQLATPELGVTIAKPAADTLERRTPYHFSATVTDGAVPVPSFNGTAESQIRESEKTDGYTTCQGDHLDYALPGHEIYRGKSEVSSGALAFDMLVPADAHEGGTGAVRCFVSDGQKSGCGLLDSLAISGESASSDGVGPTIRLKAGDRELQTGDSVAVGERLTLDLEDESGVAIKAKSLFIPAVSIQIDDGDRQDLTDSVYAVNGDYTTSLAHFAVPSLTVDSHKISVSAFDNNDNLTTQEFTLIVGSSVTQTGNVAYVYPNPAAGFCYFICQCDRLVTVKVAVYTVSGRKIWEQTSPEARSYHQIRWDGADTEGDRVANGTYLVKVEAKDPMESSFKFSKTIVVALLR
jgi:Peptidase family C25